MSTEDKDQDQVERYESGQVKEKPEPTDEHKEKAAQMAKSYEEERPTTVLPGSDHTVTGTSVNDWIDDDGSPKFGDSERAQDEEEGHRTLAKTDDRENVAD